MTNNKSNILPIVVMFLLFFMIAFVTNFAGSMGVIVKTQFGASNAMAQLGTLANFIAYAVMGIPAGMILKRKGYKFTSLLAVSVGFVGVGVQWLSGYAESFGVYVLGAFIAGFSVCMLNTVVNPLLTLMGGGGKKGNQLNLIGGTINSLSASLTPMLVGALVGASVAGKTIADVNTVLYIAMAVFAIVFIILYFTPIAEPEGAGQDVVYERTPWAFKHFVLGAVAIFLYVGIEVGIPATLISYLKDSLGFGVAGFIAGLYWLLMLVGRFIGSAIGGNVSSKTMVASVSAAAIVLIVAAMILGDTITIPFIGDWTFAIVNIPIAALLLVLCGLCTSIMWGCIFNLAVEGLGKYTAKASGIFMMMVVGGGIVPLIQSAVAGQFGEMISYIVPLVGVIYILYYALVGSKNVNTDIKID